MEKTEKEKNEERWPPRILSVLDGIDEDKLVDAAEFESFVVLILKDGAIFRSSNGFDVRCKAWSFDPAEDTSRETSLYSWLCNLVELKNSSIGKEDEEEPETGTTYGELVESLSFLTVILAVVDSRIAQFHQQLRSHLVQFALSDQLAVVLPPVE